MGLSFHYNGEISDAGRLPELIEEVKEIVSVYQWKFNVFESSFPNNRLTEEKEYTDTIYGICFTPPGSETVFISFLSNGKMSSPNNLEFFGKKATQVEQSYLYMLSVKTQYSTQLIHATIIQLFRHISAKYLSNFNLSDEGEYWETNDENVLKQNFDRYTSLIDNFALGLETLPINTNESYEQYFQRIMDIVAKHQNKK
ncbi:MAG: hypothetical protein ACERKD_03075 [Prolixibacteraceae bacterium]